jgi:hypothetical protein
MRARSNRKVYYVWLLARPPKRLSLFGLQKLFANDKYPVLHWGVLITLCSELDVNKYLEINDSTVDFNISMELGTLYQLARSQDDKNTVSITESFSLVNLRDDWSQRSAKFLGTTTYLPKRISIIGADAFEFPLIG